jgi:hypothetical protein
MTPDDLTALTHRPTAGPYVTTIEVDGVATTTLADLPPLRDRLLFVGLNPSPVSVTAGHYHQGQLTHVLAPVDARPRLPAGTPVETRMTRCWRPRHHRPAQGPDGAR